jgi:hypothetical protein
MAVIAASLGIPAVGDINIDGIEKCFKHTSVDTTDIDEYLKILARILDDKILYHTVAGDAQEASEYYSSLNSKMRYFEIVFRNDSPASCGYKSSSDSL